MVKPIHKFNLIALLVMLLLFFFSCGKRKESNGDGKAVFSFNLPANITSLDPAYAKDLNNINAVNLVFNGLVQMSSDLEILPSVAKSWEISEDGLTYTFTLRDDVFFHDHQAFKNGKGRRVVASDFRHSFYRITDKNNASPGAWIFQNIDFTRNLGFHASDDTTFQIFLKKPFPPFLGLLTMQYCAVTPFEVVEFHGQDFGHNPIGTGPFKFFVWKEGVKLILHRNENYFENDRNGNRLPYLDAVSIAFIKDKKSAFFEFIKGNLDYMQGIDNSYKDELFTMEGKLNPEYSDDISMVVEPALNTEYLGILMDRDLDLVKDGALKERAIRQAINYGINRQEMITYLRNNIGIPASAGFIPAGMPSFNPDSVKGYQFNREKARKLLTEAGYPNGQGLPQIILSTWSSSVDLCEYIQSQLADIGIQVKINVNPAATHRELVANSGLEFFRGSWYADYPDAENYLALFYSKNFSPEGPNYTHFSNAKFDELYEMAQSEVRDSIRYRYYREMDRIIIKEAPVVVLYYDQNVQFFHKNITGLEHNPMGVMNLKRLRKE